MEKLRPVLCLNCPSGVVGLEGLWPLTCWPVSFPRVARGCGSVLPISSEPRLGLSNMVEPSWFLGLSGAKDSDVWSLAPCAWFSFVPPSQPVRGVLPLLGCGKAFPEDVFELLVELTTSGSQLLSPAYTLSLTHPGVAHLEPQSLTEPQVSFLAPCLLSRSPLKMCHSTFSDCQPCSWRWG